MLTEKLLLYYSIGSNSSQRVRWALEYKRIPCNLENADAISPEDFKKISPLESVPVMRIGNKILTESVAMLELLEELVPENPLLPVDPFSRARVREVVEMVNGFLHPGQTSFVPRFYYPNIRDEDVKEYRKKWLLE